MPPSPIRFKTNDGTDYCAFGGTPYVFHNYYPATFTENGMEFNCSQQYYEWQKAKHFGDIETANQIIASNCPKEQRKMGQWMVKNFSKEEWEKKKERVRKNIFKYFNIFKF
jgi:ribA/ribD-fused uncharacterized protein